MGNDKFTDIIEVMALHEEAVSEYYAAAAESFSSSKLWEYLSTEETKHAMWLRSILDNINDETVFFNKEGLSIGQYTRYISMISAEKSEVIGKRRKLSEVFEFAVKLENDLLEKRFLDGFTSPMPGIQGTINSLKSDTEEHKMILENAYEEFRIQKKKFLESKKNNPAVTNDKIQVPEKHEPDKLLILKQKQNEISAYIEEDDAEWIEEYKKTISEISESHNVLKIYSESDEEQLSLYEQEKEKMKQKLIEEMEEERDKTDFETYYYIGLHAEYERQLANLYSLFGKIFSNDELWPFMTEEERKHEYWLKDIIRKMKEGTINFVKPIYDPEVVKNAIINIAEIIHFCREFKISHREAYNIAYDQESSILEKNILRSFKTDAPAIERVFELLIEDTIEHKNWLKKRINFYNY